MIKYFIEREDGMWLTHPGEHMGPAWTRDPFKAWAFDSHLPGPNMDSAQWRLMELRAEGVLLDSGIRITEQEFVDKPNLSPGLTHITYYKHSVTGDKEIKKFTIT